MIAAPVAGECSAHRGVKADWACQRCGSFVCKECERRTRPEAPPLCPKCWSLREQVVQGQEATESRGKQYAGLALGIFSIHPFIFIASLIFNIRELMKGRGRWMNVAGLCLSGLSVLVWILLVLVAVIGN